MHHKLLVNGLITVVFLSATIFVSAQSESRTILEETVQKLNSSYREKRYEEACEYALKSLELFERKFGKDSKESFNAIVLLGHLYAILKDRQKSDDFYFKSYALALKHFGVDSPEMDTARSNHSFFMVGDKGDNSYAGEYKKRITSIFGYEAGGLKKAPKPRWPKDAYKMFDEAKITIKTWIDANGNVTRAKAVLGNMYFAQSAEEAVGKAIFNPTLRNGMPIAHVTFITLHYRTTGF